MRRQIITQHLKSVGDGVSEFQSRSEPQSTFFGIEFNIFLFHELSYSKFVNLNMSLKSLIDRRPFTRLIQ